ncbi:hypothetical protein C2845_PM07G33110 [Panicum miliaceum]|uniref:Uncharacterized protein n=1 Tax=Panicum miliaceum TaxID=4540 RepID=A0A3L6ST86_PANMI|nr:hypothetical protein C2845_PM07G33110 [Panicum miliaceum]
MHCVIGTNNLADLHHLNLTNTFFIFLFSSYFYPLFISSSLAFSLFFSFFLLLPPLSFLFFSFYSFLLSVHPTAPTPLSLSVSLPPSLSLQRWRRRRPLPSPTARPPPTSPLLVPPPPSRYGHGVAEAMARRGVAGSAAGVLRRGRAPRAAGAPRRGLARGGRHRPAPRGPETPRGGGSYGCWGRSGRRAGSACGGGRERADGGHATLSSGHARHGRSGSSGPERRPSRPSATPHDGDLAAAGPRGRLRWRRAARVHDRLGVAAVRRERHVEAEDGGEQLRPSPGRLSSRSEAGSRRRTAPHLLRLRGRHARPSPSPPGPARAALSLAAGSSFRSEPQRDSVRAVMRWE